MQSEFNIWFNEGVQHILNWGSIDHILYLLALTIAFDSKEWKKIIMLITAFTIGHSVTLLLTALNIISINIKWVEFLIPITIAITALLNLVKQKSKIENILVLYALALFFGFIHGMAFGVNTITSFYSGNEAIWLLLAFNLGIEVAQLIIVFSIFFISFLVVEKLKLPRNYWKISLSSIILAYAIFLAIKNLP